MNTAQLEATRPKQVDAPATTPPPPVAKATQATRGHWWVYLILLAIVAGLGYFIYTRVQAAASKASDQNKSARAIHDLPVVVAKVRRGDLDQYLVGLGTVTPLKTVTVKSRVDGAITLIHFKEGEHVKVGDPLIDIDPRPYQAALQQAQGQLKRDQAAEESAEWNVQQDQIALADKAIAQQQLHTDTSAMDQAKGAIDIDNAAIATAQLNITYSHITSPIDGVIGLRLVDEGNIVHASDTAGLLVITQLQPITVVFTVAEDNIAQVQQRVASGLPMVVDAYDRDMNKKLATGKVIAIDNQIDPATGTVRIKAQFENQDNALYPSQFVNARMLVNTIQDAVLVPSAGIQHSPTSTFAYVVVPDPKAKDNPTTAPAAADGKPPREAKIVTMKDVTVGETQAVIGSDMESTTVVLSGLNPGDVVVTDGVDKLVEGTKVIPTFANGGKGRATTRQSTTMPSGASGASTQPNHRTHNRKPAANE